MEECSYHM